LNDSLLHDYLARIGRVAKKHSKEIEVVLYSPASPELLTLLETYMDRPLAKSQGDFLQRYNGMLINIADLYTFEVYGAARIIRQTEDLRNYLDLLGDGSPPYGRENVRRFFDIADIFGGVDDRIVYDVGCPTEEGEYRVFCAGMADYHPWLVAPPNPRDTDFISDSFAVFIEQALRHMIETERGFAYWSRDLDLDLWDQ